MHSENRIYWHGKHYLPNKNNIIEVEGRPFAELVALDDMPDLNIGDVVMIEQGGEWRGVFVCSVSPLQETLVVSDIGARKFPISRGEVVAFIQDEKVTWRKS